MALRGKREFMVHYGGDWGSDGNKYVGGKCLWLKNIDGDEMCLMDMVSEIKEKGGVQSPIIKWLWNGSITLIHDDADLLTMWDNIKAYKNIFHLYVEESNVSPTKKTPDKNKGPTTPSKIVISPVVTPRRSPRFSNDTSTLEPIQPRKKKPILTPTRRSLRLLSNFQFKFSSKEPLVISDEEGELTGVEPNASLIENDWAFTNLLENTFEGIDPTLSHNDEAPTVDERESDAQQTENTESTNEWSYSDFDHLDADDNYYSEEVESEDQVEDEDNISVEENIAVGENIAAEDNTPTAAEREEDNIGNNKDFEDFVLHTQNCYQEEDNERLQDQGVPKSIEELHETMEWPTMKDCRIYMRRYAIWKKFEYRQRRNDNLKIDLVCKDPFCPWRVSVRRLPNNHTARMRALNNKHNCKCDEKGKNLLAHAGWVANEVESALRNHKEFKPKDVQALIWEKHGVKVSYWTSYQARLICHERIYGGYNEGYKKCPELCNQILTKNPGSVTAWLRCPEDQGFLLLVVAYKASLDGFVKGCRPILGLDGAFLKGKYGGAVLSVISLDGNNGLFPIDICICRGENYDNWSRFLRYLAPHLNLHKDPLTFMSDRQKGLVQAIEDVFPQSSHHRYCFRHLYKNFKNFGFKGQHLEHLSWGAARAYKKEEFENWMKTLGKVDPKAKEWLEQEPFECWARSHFDTTSKCEHITNNFSESFNKMILVLRDMPLIKLVEKYELMVMGLLYNRRTNMGDVHPDSLVPRVVETIEKLKRNYNKFTTQGSTDYLHVAINKHGISWTVDLNEKTCTCYEWQISGIPCIHAIAVIMPRREQWARYCSPYFKYSCYIAAYTGHVHPMENTSYWPEPQHVVHPPPLERPAGRPRVKRRKDVDEQNAPRRAKKQCGKCGLLGHNKKTCKGAPASKQSGNKGRPAAEGPSTQQETSSRTALIIPSQPVQRTSLALRGKKRGRGESGRKTFQPITSLGPQVSFTATTTPLGPSTPQVAIAMNVHMTPVGPQSQGMSLSSMDK